MGTLAWLALLITISSLAGAVIGRLFSKRKVTIFIVSLATSMAFLLLFQWGSGTIGKEWSLDYPVATVVHNFGFYCWFLWLPMLASAFYFRARFKVH